MNSKTNRHFARRTLAPGAAVGILLAGSAIAIATTFSAGIPVRVPDNPLGGGAACAALVAQSEALGSVNSPAAEVEPSVASDPAAPLHLVGSFQQARCNDGGANALPNVVPHDAGA